MNKQNSGRKTQLKRQVLFKLVAVVDDGRTRHIPVAETATHWRAFG